MKKIAIIMLAVMFIFTGLNTLAEESNLVRLGGLKGPTSMGMVKLLSDAENNLCINTYEFTMAASADELTPKLLRGELDILAVPANLGAVLYNKTGGQITFLAVNTLGVIDIVEKGDRIHSIEDLKDCTIYATGKGSTPEYALNYLLNAHGLEIGKDVTVEWKSEPVETIAAIQAGNNGIAMIPQPFVTVAQGQVEGLRIALNLSEEWDKLGKDSMFITAGLIARRAFVEENPETVAAFLNEYCASTVYVNENITEAAQLVEKYDIVKAAIAEKAIPYCNITFISGEEMKTATTAYFEVLFAQNAASVGGTLPDDDFYYIP